MSNPEDPELRAPRRWQTEEVAVQKLAARDSTIAASTNTHPLLGLFTAYPELPPLRTTASSAESSRWQHESCRKRAARRAAQVSGVVSRPGPPRPGSAGPSTRRPCR